VTSSARRDDRAKRAPINVYAAEKTPTVAHDGEGSVEVVRPLSRPQLETALMFVDFVEIPPASSIGVHRHGDDEELYFVIEGRGLMTVEDRRYRVGPGDLILNPRFGTHGLLNDRDRPMKVLVWQVRGEASPRSEN
jgi:mannose-6-phosphate isomerase-like protein (cupin superfamily)